MLDDRRYVSRPPQTGVIMALGAFITSACELPGYLYPVPHPASRWRDCERSGDQGLECPGWECKHITHPGWLLMLPCILHTLLVIIMTAMGHCPHQYSPFISNFENKPDGLVLVWMLNGQLKLEKYFYCLSLSLWVLLISMIILKIKSNPPGSWYREIKFP